MAVLRIMEYPATDDLPDNAAELWQKTIGVFLQTAPCHRAVLAANDDRMTVVTEWESTEALEATLGSDEYLSVLTRLTEEFGMGEGPAATHAFHGEIQASV